MKSKIFLFGTILLLIAEIIALIIFAVQTPDLSQDAVAVNEIVQTVTDDFNNMEEHRNTTALNYVVLDNSGNLLYKTQSGLSESINVAITHRDTILDITIDKTQVGKIIIYNDGTQTLQYQKQTAVIVLSVAIVIQIFICIGYTVYLYLSVIRPFRKLKGFAERVAGGNLDMPLAMDRHNLFGAFTESFDIMRSELKKPVLPKRKHNRVKRNLLQNYLTILKRRLQVLKQFPKSGLRLRQPKKTKQTILKSWAKPIK